METFAEINKEACLLDLKYKHLVEVCESLLQPWHNRDTGGKLVKKAGMEKAGTAVGESTKESIEMLSSAGTKAEDNSKGFADLQLLDNILSKAQQIREGEDRKPSKKTTTMSMAMAAQAYGQYNAKLSQRKSSSATVKAKHQSSRAKSTTAVQSQKTKAAKSTVCKPKPQTSTLNRKDVTASASVGSDSHSLTVRGRLGEETPSCKDDIDELKDEGFYVQASGQRMSMPSRFSKLHKLLTRINAQLKDVTAESSGNTGAEHFARRLLSDESIGSTTLISLLLKVGEYSLFIQDLLAVTTKEWSVSDKSQWQDVLRVNMKVNSILERIHNSQIGQQSNSSMGSYPLPLSATAISAKSTKQFNSTALKSSQLGYTDLKHLQELALLEQLLVIEAWEARLCTFIGSTVLPYIMKHSEQMSQMCGLFQCVRVLLGTNENTASYLLVDHE